MGVMNVVSAELARHVLEKAAMNLRGRVLPVRGTVFYCEMAGGAADHSGVYVGGGHIVELKGTGDIQKVELEEFMDVPGFPVNVYMPCRDGKCVGLEDAAGRAENRVGRHIDYNLVLNNCHKFTCGCVTGDFNNSNTLLRLMRPAVESALGANEWRALDKAAYNRIVEAERNIARIEACDRELATLVESDTARDRAFFKSALRELESSCDTPEFIAVCGRIVEYCGGRRLVRDRRDFDRLMSSGKSLSI